MIFAVFTGAILARAGDALRGGHTDSVQTSLLRRAVLRSTHQLHHVLTRYHPRFREVSQLRLKNVRCSLDHFGKVKTIEGGPFCITQRQFRLLLDQERDFEFDSQV